MEDNDDIFKEAAKETLSAALRRENDIEGEDIHSITSSAQDLTEAESEEEWVVTDPQSQANIALTQVEEGDKWDNLTKYMSGEGANRMLQELRAMPSRDFSRNYLKLLEHFKPKLVRSDSSPNDDVDRTIQVELVQQLPNGERRTISINKTEKSGNNEES